MTITFGRQRPGTDIAAVALLLTGFTAIAWSMWLARGAWLGVLLPIAFVIGIVSGFRTEVRAVDLDGDRMTLRTFFRAYPIPRAHITRVVLTDQGLAIEVLNGARYFIDPRDVDAAEMYRVVREWHAAGTAAQPTDAQE